MGHICSECHYHFLSEEEVPSCGYEPVSVKRGWNLPSCNHFLNKEYADAQCFFENLSLKQRKELYETKKDVDWMLYGLSSEPSILFQQTLFFCLDAFFRMRGKNE